ncbi:MFS transporter [Staphylococcus gallinarum]|uniref:MFS transporter n=2 Tax=Staphylococcus gallinarum TaxID=1293 RepID=A0ABQ0XY34_STAGA|nr:MFS transporter [Staphylococcus gallinarum]KIR12318.1 major facilitator transporter [Staphylococcus gallinarum]MEB7039075.1 MFS transporter [Staphylococcus gallinarum]RTX79332.1 MFS transporter [Staphylococcus gallinarum]GEQ04253.1 MFS transporter [Staphylococcus gallinarum]
MNLKVKKTKGWVATIAIAMANYIEAGSIIAAASSLSLWQSYLNLNNVQIGLLGALSANALGAAIGALIGGPITDKLGRKFIFKYDLILYMIGMLVLICSFNFSMLLIGTIVIGIAVGIGVPVAWTYIAEEAPEKERAKRIGTAQLAWSIGPTITFLLAVIVSPMGLLGSRIIFVHLFIIAGITWWIRQGMNESEIWEAEKEKERKELLQDVKKTSVVKELFTNLVNLKAMLLLIGIYLFWNLTSGAMGYFMPFIYESIGGLSSAQANILQAILWFLTVITTYFGFMKLGDKLNQRLLFGIGAAMGILAWIIITFIPMNWVSLILFVVLWGSAAGIGAQAFYALWTSELFPTRYRAGAQGLMYFIVRTGISIYSFILPTILATLGFKMTGIIMIIFLIIHSIIGIVLTPKTQGKTLSQIEKERYGESPNTQLLSTEINKLNEVRD